MLIYSMSVSVDGFIADRAGGFGWTVPNEEEFRSFPPRADTGARLLSVRPQALRDHAGVGDCDRARPRRRAAYVPQSDPRRWRHAVPAAGHRRRPPGLDRDQDVGSRVIYQ